MIALDEPPGRDVIASIRRRFPVDPVLDAVLTRKMERRGGAAYACLPLAEIERRLLHFLRMRSGDQSLSVSGLRRLTGGASKEQFVFDLLRGGRGVSRHVLRIDPAESLADTSRLQEYELLRAAAACVPVPAVDHVDPDGDLFGQPALITTFVDGVTRPTLTAAGNVSGFGTAFDAEWRDRLKRPFVECLARIHGLDVAAADLPSFAMPRAGTTDAAQSLLNWHDRLWAEDALEEIPIAHAASTWLRANMPATERLSIVHGDYRPGNFLFDEASGAITAILDWEMGRIGDPYEDLGYTLQRPGMGVIGDDGEMLIGGLLSESEFLELYEQYSGRAIDHKRLHYYRIMQARKCVNIIGTGVRAAAGGRMHMDMIGLWLAAVGYSFVAELRALLEKEI